MDIKQTVLILGSILTIAMMVQGVNAQFNSASIDGYIFNETGAPLGGALVEWRNTATGEFIANSTSATDGFYFMNHMYDGTMESLINASKVGYSANSTVISMTAAFPPAAYHANLTLEQDVTPPNIINLQPPNGSIMSTNTPTISAEYSDASGINTGAVTVSVDEIDVTASAAITESGISYEPSPLAEGEHNVSVYVEDNANNPATANWTFTVDTVSPIVNITSPINKTYMVDTVDLNCTVTDINEISCVWYSLDGESNITLPATGPTTYGATLSGLTSDTHCVTVYANDTAENIGYASVCFTIEAKVKVNISLYSEWNMFAVQINVSNWTLPTVLESIDGKYNYVYYFNATTDTMDYYIAGHPEVSTLKELEPGAGYLIDMKEDHTLQFEGMKFIEPSRDLESEWNMFSVPYGIVNRTLPTVLESIDGKYNYVYYFNATTDTMDYYIAGHPEVSTLKELEPGAGYLIDMKEAATFVPEMG